jgi:hypothetical protein
MDAGLPSHWHLALKEMIENKNAAFLAALRVSGDQLSAPSRDSGHEAWIFACRVHTYAAYETYVRLFPDGEFHQLALQRYRKLKPFWKRDRFK